ncbi:MAG: ROK family protein [Frankiaceae bacterium]
MSEPRPATGAPAHALALDIGGTKLAAALVDSEGRVTAASRIATPATGSEADAESLWRTVEALAAGALAAAGDPPLAGVGVGCGGPMSWPAGLVSPLRIPAWRDFPLRERVAAAYPGLPVRLHNDASCLTAGEHWRGAGRGRDHVLGMVVSTGVGGGLVLGGRLADGATGNAGHIGHVVVDPDGPPCACGGTGCLEAVARGPAALAWARDNGWAAAPGAGGAELVADADRGHPVAAAALARAGRALGIAIASAVALLDVEVVAIGGGLVQAGRWLLDPLEEAYRSYARLDFAREVPVVAAALGQQAGLVGAAALVHRGERYWSAG